MDLITDQHFQKLTSLDKAEYDTCRFTGCDFSDQHLSGYTFIECEFEDCNLSNSRIKDTGFKDVSFVNCKLMGLNFAECDPFLLQLYFRECNLGFGSFLGLTIDNTTFKDCNLTEADFSQASCKGASFSASTLERSIFNQTHLESADFCTANNLSIDPENNFLKKARFSQESALGLLSKYGIIIKS